MSHGFKKCQKEKSKLKIVEVLILLNNSVKEPFFHLCEVCNTSCICFPFRSFTDLQRTHVLFSLAVPTFANGFMVLWDGADKELEIYTQDKFAVFGKTDYKQNTWHSICATWDSASGLVQLWLDGLPSVRKFTNSGSNIRGSLIIMLGQVNCQSSSIFHNSY